METCPRCKDSVFMLKPAECPEHPEKLKGHPLTNYHCPDCGTLLSVGTPHPMLCYRCVDRIHPGLDMDDKMQSGEFS